MLYANGSNSKSFRFYLEDVCKSLTPEGLNSKLLEVDYRDTYRDEPFIYHIKMLNLLIETCSLSSESSRHDSHNHQASDSHHHPVLTEESVTNLESNRNSKSY